MDRKRKGKQPPVRLPRTIYDTCVVRSAAMRTEDGELKVGLFVEVPGHLLVFPMPPEYAEGRADEIIECAKAIQEDQAS